MKYSAIHRGAKQAMGEQLLRVKGALQDGCTGALCPGATILERTLNSRKCVARSPKRALFLFSLLHLFVVLKTRAESYSTPFGLSEAPQAVGLTTAPAVFVAVASPAVPASDAPQVGTTLEVACH